MTGLTLSTEQHAYAQRRAGDSCLNDQVRFLLKDYRQEKVRYDRTSLIRPVLRLASSSGSNAWPCAAIRPRSATEPPSVLGAP